MTALCTALVENDDSYLVFLLRQLHPHRSESLFTKFLPTGYKLVSLYKKNDSVADILLKSKVLLGTWITFEDDLSDHPEFFDLEALECLYGVKSKIPKNSRTKCNIYVSRAIRRSILDYAQMLPFYKQYEKLLGFDLNQFTNANHYSALQRLYPFLQNLIELKHFGPFNMGMVAAATLDLMAIEDISPEELRAVREASYLGQRAGRISNIMTTLERENSLQDFTNEALVGFRSHTDYLGVLVDEHKEILKAIKSLHSFSKKVDLLNYAEGIQKLHELHFSSKNFI